MVQDDDVISFALPDEESGSEQYSDDKHNPHIPPPAGSLRDESTTDRTQDGAEENAHRIHRDRLAALRGNEQVCNHACANGQTRAATQTGKEAHGNKSAEIRRERAPERKGAEEDIADIKNDATTIDLGEWGEEQRSNLHWPSVTASKL